MKPSSPAPSTISGKGTAKANMARKEAAASAHSTRFFKAREPMRQAAKTTMATTAGLIPSKTALTGVISPKAM